MIFRPDTIPDQRVPRRLTECYCISACAEGGIVEAASHRMICRRALAAGIKIRTGNHTFRATGITQYLRNGGRRELAQQMAAHESPRTTALYDRRDDEVAVDKMERILI